MNEISLESPLGKCKYASGFTRENWKTNFLYYISLSFTYRRVLIFDVTITQMDLFHRTILLIILDIWFFFTLKYLLTNLS